MSSVFSFTPRPFQDDNSNSNCLWDNHDNSSDGGGVIANDSSDSELDGVSGGRHRRKQRRFKPKLRKIARKDSNSSSPDFISAKRGMKKTRAAATSSDETCIYEGSMFSSTQFNTDFKDCRVVDHDHEKKPAIIHDNGNHMRVKLKEISGEEALRLYNLNWPNYNPTTGTYQSYKQKQLLGGVRPQTQPSSSLPRCPETNVEQKVVSSSSIRSSDSSSSDSDSSPAKLKHRKGLLRSRKELGGDNAFVTSEPGGELMQNDVVLKTLAALRADEISSDTSGDDTTSIGGREAMVAATTKRRSHKGDTKRYVKVIVSLCMGEEGSGGGIAGDSQQQYSVKAELGESLRSITDKALHIWGMEAEDVDAYVFQDGNRQVVNNLERSLKEIGIGKIEREPRVELWKKGRLHCAAMLEVQMVRTTRFGCLKKYFSDKFHLTTAQEKATKFEFDGENLYDNSTPMPESLDMDDNDEIKVSVKDIDMTELQSCKVLIVPS